MAPEIQRADGGYRPGSPRQRVLSSVLSAGLVLLALFLALWMTGAVPETVRRSALTSFDISGDESRKGGGDEAPAEPVKSAEKLPQQQAAAVVPPPEPQPVTSKSAFTFMKLSRSDMAMADIGKMTGPGPAAAAPAGSAGTYGPGEGPGGVVLHNADWYRKPSQAQLSGYLPASHPATGYGMIACQTLEGYRVENCQILGESPRGSGFGRAVLDAAWQFQVIPPKVNGKPQLGTWVRIRIDYGANVEVDG